MTLHTTLATAYNQARSRYWFICQDGHYRSGKDREDGDIWFMVALFPIR